MKYYIALLLINAALINSAPLNDIKNPIEGKFLIYKLIFSQLNIFILLGELFEGDMAGVRIVQSNNTKGYAQIETNSYGLWTGGKVPYIIDNVYSKLFFG